MGDSIEQWRAKIGQWSGGRPRKCSALQHQISQTSDHIGYMQIRFLVLVSLLIIGCVELNPGPNQRISGPNPSAGAVPKFRRRPGSVGLHGELYGLKTAAFLFARGLNRTEEFQLASNVDGAGAIDDLVFRYRLRDTDVLKTCFIQLKHKKSGGTIQRSSLTQMSGNYSLLKYFKSYCEIKNNAATHPTLKQCGPFVDFEFVIYTNEKMDSNFPLQGGHSDPLSILSSGKENGKYVTFDETRDKDIFEFFEDLSEHYKLIGELDSLLKSRTSVDKKINEKIKGLQNSVQNPEILEKLNSLKSTVNTDYVTKWTDELAKCDFKLFKEFLSKVKIFQTQSNEESFKRLTESEIQEACKASPSVANFIYTKFEEGVSKWWKKDGNVVWLNQNADLWQTIQREIENEIRKISKPETQEIEGCDIRFNQQNVGILSEAIEKNTVLNIVTKSNISTLQKLRTYQALNILGYKNSLFIGRNSLMNKRKEIKQLWPCKWSDVMVVDCDTDVNMTHTVLDILQQSAECSEQGLDSSDDITAETLVLFLQKYQQKLILISTQQGTSGIQEKLRNVTCFEHKCDISDLDEKSQKQILERPVNFQGTSVPLLTLVGTDPPESINTLLDSEVISVLLSNKHGLSVGRQISELTTYYVPRVLQHQIYLKECILKLRDKAITFAISGLQAEELKKYLPAGEKICEFVYNEREEIHTFKTVSYFSETGLSAEFGNVTTHQTLGQNTESDEVSFNIIGNKDKENEFNEGSNINSFSMVDTVPKYGVGAELENTKTYNNARQKIKPEEGRYIIFGNKSPDREFNELKTLDSNVHWIHVAEGSFLWRDSNCNIDIIRKNIDNTKYEKYDMNCVVEHSDRTMLLVDEPGMGKSTFLSYMAHEIKKLKPSVWVLKINLNEYTNELEDTDFKQKCIEKCKEFLWRAAHSTEQNSLKFTKEIFLQALGQAGKMVIILDGFDEISPDYSDKVKMLITAIRDETASEIWISSRFYCRQELEDILGKFAFTLQPFTSGNQIQFLEQYWSEVTEISNRENLQTFAKNLLCLCSKNISDKDGEFTGIPLQTMMLGNVFVNEAKEYCCNGEISLPEKFDLLSLFKKFTEKKFDIFREKNRMDSSKPGVKIGLKDYEQKHMIAALLYLFSKKEVKELRGAINSGNLVQTKYFLREGKAQIFGIITGIIDGKPHFIHRSFAEYFAAKWFTDNFRDCKKSISNMLFNSTNEVTWNMFDRMLAEDSEIHGFLLKGDIHALRQILKNKPDINSSDNGGRTALHLAASYNSPYIQTLLSVPGIDVNKRDKVLKWTPLKYADRTKSWIAMDILLQNGANANDIVFTRNNAKAPDWGQAAVWECASKGHIKLLEFMLDCGIEVNGIVKVQENVNENFTLLHKASYCGQVEVVRLIVNRGADINIRSANNNTALHLAAASGSVNVINLLLNKGMSVNLTDNNESTPLHVSAEFGHLEATKALVKRGAAINSTNKYRNTPLIAAAYSGKSEIFSYLTEIGADINILGEKNNTAIHFASASGNLDIIKLLLNKGISVNLANCDRITPLHISAQFGHLEATKMLVDRGADIKNTNKYGNTPLLLAGYNGKFEIFRYLTEIGADINIRNIYKNTALHLVSALGCVDIINILLDKGLSVNLANSDGFTPLHISAQFGHLEATKTLVDRGADINKTTKHGNTPLLMAGYNSKLETFRYITENGADINIPNAYNNTALHLVSAFGYVDIINMLLDKGISVNLSNDDGFTPLHFSAQFGHLEATKTLLDRGADINNTNKHGSTPLLVALYNGKFEIFRYLTEISADINISNA